MYLIIDATDIEDYLADIREAGQDPDDFELLETVITLIGPEAGRATVRHRRSGVERSYPMGHGTKFPADFAVELRQGVFT
jgi:hypothetical protein